MVDALDLEGALSDHGKHWSSCSVMGRGRDHNSDAIAVSLSGRCLSFVVADGVGAMAGSPLASTAAAKSAADWIAGRAVVEVDDVPSLMKHVDRAVEVSLRDAAVSGATTIVALALRGGAGLLATVGDSEAIAVPESGPAVRLNPVDHLPNRPNVLTAWIDGKESYTPHVIQLSRLPYRLCLMTDGVCGVLADGDIANIVRSVPLQDAARGLVMAARAAGSMDDASCIVISSGIAPSTNVGLLSKLGRVLRRGARG